jgi:hypothetical protein
VKLFLSTQVEWGDSLYCVIVMMVI